MDRLHEPLTPTDRLADQLERKLKGANAENERLRNLIEKAFREGFGEGWIGYATCEAREIGADAEVDAANAAWPGLEAFLSHEGV